jgi:hypothetical protein
MRLSRLVLASSSAASAEATARHGEKPIHLCQVERVVLNALVE